MLLVRVICGDAAVAMEAIRPASLGHEFSAAEIGALAHLYRGEVYRSTIWRTRLDNTTNWAVVTTGIALSGKWRSLHQPCRRCAPGQARGMVRGALQLHLFMP